MTMRALGLLVLSVTVCGPLLAQDPPARERVERQVEEMRRQVVEGNVIRSHVRVTVRLKNGNRIRGIVKDGFLVERVDGLRFVSAEKDEPGAGLRLYYWNGTNNYVFLPFEDMKEYTVNQRLSSTQLAAIERQAREQKERERQQRAAELAKEQAERGEQPGDRPGADPKPAGETGGEAGGKADADKTGKVTDGMTQELQELYQLLQQYPPSEGWSAAKRDEIKNRINVVGANPSPKEWKFVERFDDWTHARKLFGLDGDKADGDKGEPGQQGGQGSGTQPGAGGSGRRQPADRRR